MYRDYSYALSRLLDKIAFCMTCQKDKEIPDRYNQRQAVTTITGEQQKCAKSEDHVTISNEAVSKSH